MKKIIAQALCAAFVASAAVCAADAARQSQKISESVIRLHILADDDSQAAQELKLQVRDAVLENSGELFAAANSKSEAERTLSSNLEFFEQTAESVLRAAGAGYGAEASFGNKYFPTREYDGFSLPAGRYDSLTITLGGGEGKNWWCVIYPALCCGASVSKELEPIVAADKINVRFKLVDLIGSLKG